MRIMKKEWGRRKIPHMLYIDQIIIIAKAEMLFRFNIIVCHFSFLIYVR